MKRNRRFWAAMGCAVSILGVLGSGCERKSEPASSTSADAKSSSSTAKEKPKEPLIKKPQIADWCPEHGVPESICTRCNPSLVEGFKKKNDWCKEHGLPESQCLQCHPELKEKLEAMKPKSEG